MCVDDEMLAQSAPWHLHSKGNAAIHLPFDAKVVDFSQRSRWKFEGFLIPSDEQIVHAFRTATNDKRQESVRENKQSYEIRKRKSEELIDGTNDSCWEKCKEIYEIISPPTRRSWLDDLPPCRATKPGANIENQSCRDRSRDENTKEDYGLKSDNRRTWEKPTRSSVSNTNGLYNITEDNLNPKASRRITIQGDEASRNFGKYQKKPAAGFLGGPSSPESYGDSPADTRRKNCGRKPASNNHRTLAKPAKRLVTTNGWDQSPENDFEPKASRRITIHRNEASSKVSASPLGGSSSPESPRYSAVVTRPTSRRRIFQPTSKRVHHRLRQSKLSFAKKT